MLEFILWTLGRSKRKRPSASPVQIEILEKFKQPSGLGDALLSPFGSEIPKSNQFDRIARDIQKGTRRIDDIEQVPIDSIPMLREILKRALKLRSARYVFEKLSYFSAAR